MYMHYMHDLVKVLGLYCILCNFYL